jgi:hypothetical protein
MNAGRLETASPTGPGVGSLLSASGAALASCGTHSLAGNEPKSGSSIPASAGSPFVCFRSNSSADPHPGDKTVVCKSLRTQMIVKADVGTCRILDESSAGHEFQ